MESDATLSPMQPLERPEGYPVELEQWVELPSGHRMFHRPIIPEDVARIEYAFAHADIETLRRRFFTAAPPTDKAHIEYLATVDYRNRLALVGMDAHGAGVGIGRYERTGATEAEVAIVVAPEWRCRGVGSVLLEALEAPARHNGIERLIALYLPENKAVDGLLAGIGYGDRIIKDGITEVTKAL